VPESWLAGGEDAARYLDYLNRRLAEGEFVQEAENARLTA